MKTNRRLLLRTASGAALVLGAGAFGLSRCDRMPSSAIAGWQGPDIGETDPRVRALSLAMLAPSPHNMQGWIADIGQPDTVTLYADTDRLLPETDPFGRQTLIGQGTFIELLDIAAREQGYRTDITLYPDGGDDPSTVTELPIARIGFVGDPTVAKDALFAQITRRRSTKEPYDMDRRPDDTVLAELAGTDTRDGVDLRTTAETDLVGRLMDLTGQAVMTEIETPRTLRESIDVLRIGADEIAANPDGIELHGPMIWWLHRLGLMTREKAMTPGTLAYQGGIDYAAGWVAATPAFGWLTTPGNRRTDQIAAGRAYVRLNLKATEMGLAMHPVSQLLQEYPEMADLQQAFLAATQTQPGHTVQMLFRLGYADPVGASPRRPVDAILRG